jgi:hypothetical protein
MKLSKGKAYFSGATQDIEDISLKLRTKMLDRYAKFQKNAGKKDEVFRTGDWLKWVVSYLGGTIRYCDPYAYTGETCCMNHGVITVHEEGDFLVHNSAVMTQMYNNAETATALGFYFLNWDRETSDVIFSWADNEIAWQARRFGMALLIPKDEVITYLESNGYADLSGLHLGNYEWYADHHHHLVAGHYEVSSDPVKIRLTYLFKELSINKELEIQKFEAQYMCT